MTTTLYDQDFFLWLEKTAQLLREGKYGELDFPNLIEEIEAMGRSEKRAVRNKLKILLVHLLKYRYQPNHRSNSWKYTISEHRERLEESFKDSPSLKRYFPEVFEETYRGARRIAAAETGLSIDTFPAEPLFTPEETLDSEFYPEHS